ncbi:thiopurine S-methyltransferase [Thermomonas haemolytica]|uniref:Thiopurine S-methyltransferase n=1 Tax=Thermomonas haemolytica TaxID=141949 RepID=A0A4R3N9G1_9GAMM|nr:thiopurine S-methyltransferase [Thermomonas haemolytica]TCT26038.1 thiopurine S-methyltransferase [Thermomonas haemolytica]TNY28978.1 thiopurine S-methyltransferase [Thermomonas haemolytica]
MQPDFWQQRWANHEIGFHQPTPTPLLLKHWPALAVPAGAQVFVPLCGKSLDLAWLAAQGHRVLGVELSQIAVDEFFAEHGLMPEVEETRYGLHHRAGGIELICGDAFGLDAELLAGCAAVFDRAALIALPSDMRQRYARELYARLPQGCRGLLLTLEYPQAERDGPPFSVEQPEVEALYADHWRVQLLEQRPIPPGSPGFIDGLSRLDTRVYRLDRR